MPYTAINKLNPTNILSQAPSNVTTALECPIESLAAKYYLVYHDAWWFTKLKKVFGCFSSYESIPPINGRYHDGPIKCSDTGECKGALLVTYTFNASAVDYYSTYRVNDADPLTVLNPGDDIFGKLLTDTHTALMNYHLDEFQQRGIDPATIVKPELGVIATWRASFNTLYPGTGYSDSDSCTSNEVQNSRLVVKPLSNYNVYVVNEYYSPTGGWAEGSLILAERAMHDLGLYKPTFISNYYYDTNIISTFGNENIDIKDDRVGDNCD